MIWRIRRLFILDSSNLESDVKENKMFGSKLSIILHKILIVMFLSFLVSSCMLTSGTNGDNGDNHTDHKE